MSAHVPSHVPGRRDSDIQHDGDDDSVRPSDSGPIEDKPVEGRPVEIYQADNSLPRETDISAIKADITQEEERVDGIDIASIFKYFSPDIEYDRSTVHTLNSSQQCPNGIKFVILFPGAHPRWRDYILFIKTAIDLLPGYTDEKPKFEQAKKEHEKEMAAKKRAEREQEMAANKKREDDIESVIKTKDIESEDIVASVRDPSSKVPTKSTDGQSLESIQNSPDIQPKVPNNTASNNPVGDLNTGKDDGTTSTTGGTPGGTASEPDTVQGPKTQRSRMKYTDVRLEQPDPHPTEHDTNAPPMDNSRDENLEAAAKFDALDYPPPPHTPIAVFRAFDGNGHDCGFIGWYTINKLCILPAQSPRIKDLLQEKWGSAAQARRGGGGYRGGRDGGRDGGRAGGRDGGRDGGRGSGRGGGRRRGRAQGRNPSMRWNSAWDKDMATEWAVLRFGRLKPGSEECPPEPEVEQWMQKQGAETGVAKTLDGAVDLLSIDGDAGSVEGIKDTGNVVEKVKIEEPVIREVV